VLVGVTAIDPLVVLTTWLPNAMPGALRLTAGAIPVPLSMTVCGVPLASSAIEILAARLPVAVGVKVALMVQLAPAPSVLGLIGQPLLGVKSPGLLPTTLTLPMVSGAVPLFVTITDCDPLVV